MSLKNKCALITGATEGIGYSIAKRFLKEGSNVFLCSRKPENVEKAINDLKQISANDIYGLPCNVGKNSDRKLLVEATVEKFGHIDTLVCNVGVSPHFGDLLSISESAWDKIFEINVKSTFFLVKSVVPHMKKPGSSILIVSSIGGYHPFPGIMAYSISKTTLFGLTKALAATLSPEIRVNCVAPGVIETKFSNALVANDDISSFILPQIPLKRYGKPDDVSGACAFLCSDDASYITGETLVIGGGAPSKL